MDNLTSNYDQEKLDSSQNVELGHQEKEKEGDTNAFNRSNRNNHIDCNNS